MRITAAIKSRLTNKEYTRFSSFTFPCIYIRDFASHWAVRVVSCPPVLHDQYLFFLLELSYVQTSTRKYICMSTISLYFYLLSANSYTWYSCTRYNICTPLSSLLLIIMGRRVGGGHLLIDRSVRPCPRRHLPQFMSLIGVSPPTTHQNTIVFCRLALHYSYEYERA